jgi:hypothetical protein
MLNDVIQPWDRSTQPERNPMSNPILLLGEGFTSHEVVAAVEPTSVSANFQSTMYRMEDVRINAGLLVGSFVEALSYLKGDGSSIFPGLFLSAIYKKKRFNDIDVGYILSLFTSCFE